ncbi:vascular cell adhesion protein 1 isoform X2 [Pteronotus mesoamericanus]|uniref:vascular cell adhesion protein 1 isoform X2 n=1 Tax=Pteronotus mesoamericanus TaxID=1884717 RepID=UPI0023EAE0B8|nr:vascular cell adhesion protein 1 isoform X2 [Pteronotus parnellii mesoamericanus]
MPGKMVMIFGVSNILWMVFVASQAFKIETIPESQIVAQIGGSVSLVCSTTGCESPSFSWRTQIDSPLNGKVRNEGSMSTLTLDPVGFGNEHSYLCTAACGSRKEERGIEVQIYSFPKDPEIQLSAPLEVGKPVTATCLVPDVYPLERLEVDLRKGGHLLKNQEFLEPAEKKSLETKGLEVTFTPTREDIGKALVCQARLNLPEIDEGLQQRATTEILQVHVAPKNTVISVNPSTRLPEGGSVTMTCSSEGLPAPQITWSKKSEDGRLQPLSANGTLTLIAMRMEDSGIYVCEGVNLVGEDRKEVELIVQEKPFAVEISPGPQVAAQIGDSVVLTCGVTGCESPSISWRTQIDSPLNGQVRSAGATSTLTLSAVSFENEHSYLCTVTCGRKKQEKGIKVDLYSFPRDPEIAMSGGLVSGQPVTVSCKVPDVYPLDRLQIQLLKGEHVMERRNFLEDMEKKSLETRSLETTFIPTTEDTGTVLVCQAELQIDEMDFEPKQRQSTQTLSVNIAPRNMSVLVSPSSTLEEGRSVHMTCSGDGLPAPKIRWSRQLPNGSLQFLSENTTLTLTSTKRGDSGIYVCEGSNQAGTSRKEVKLLIQERESNKDYFSPGLLMLYCASSLLLPAIGMIVYFARRANMKGSYSLVDAQKSKV